jgi:hypothetical protein
MGSIPAQPAEEMGGERWDARRAAQSRAFWRDLLSICGLLSQTNVWSEYGRSYSIYPKV